MRYWPTPMHAPVYTAAFGVCGFDCELGHVLLLSPRQRPGGPHSTPGDSSLSHTKMPHMLQSTQDIAAMHRGMFRSHRPGIFQVVPHGGINRPDSTVIRITVGSLGPTVPEGDEISPKTM